MYHYLFLLPLLLLLACQQPEKGEPLVGIYELRNESPFSFSDRFHGFTIGEEDISFSKSGHFLGTGTSYWKGRYITRDSILEVLVYYSGFQDGNVGFTTTNTRQKRLKLTIREEDGNPVLVRKYPKLRSDSTALLMGISQPTTEIFAKVYDTVKFHPPPVADCEGYGNYHFQQRVQQKRPPDSTQLVEQQVYDLLTTHLNRNLPKLEVKKVSNRPPSATALLKSREVPDFPAEKVIIVDNSSPHSTEILAKALSTFLEKNMRLFKDPSLQGYLLVVMVVTDEGVCVLPPQGYPHWGF